MAGLGALCVFVLDTLGLVENDSVKLTIRVNQGTFFVEFLVSCDLIALRPFSLLDVQMVLLPLRSNRSVSREDNMVIFNLVVGDLLFLMEE